MRLLVQRVKRASVIINGNLNDKREISQGMCIFVGVTHNDNEASANWLAEKISGLRIFADNDGKTNLSIQDINGELLIVSQFSLYASLKGRRPGFSEAAKPDLANKLYEHFIEKLRAMNFKKIATGEFGADMEVEIINDGPLTFIIDAPENLA